MVMNRGDDWVDVGAAAALSKLPLQRVMAGNIAIALSFAEGQFGAISNDCNHVGGPLGDGRLAGDYVKCPWHGWKFHRCTGVGEPGFEDDRVPSFPVKVENGRVLINPAGATKRAKKPHEPHPLSREVERAEGPLRIAGISTTAMDADNPRFSVTRSRRPARKARKRGSSS
jgi:nitrite reductase/ring-hydroxylating ferredoxin subunit